MVKKKKQVKEKNSKKKLTLYLVLRALVIVSIVLNVFRGDYNNVFLCVLTLLLFTIPTLVSRKFKVEIPSFLEGTIYLFIFSAQILGEIQNFYGMIPYWDTMLHTINGFLAAAIGFALIDILNSSKTSSFKLSPIFVAIVSFCFSMTIGVIWEFFEFGMDQVFQMDMQKDRIVEKISTVELNSEGANEVVIVDNIEYTVMYHLDENNEQITTTIPDGYLDVGIIDTMKDLLVNFMGAVVFSIIGLLYIKNRDKYKFAEKFIPTLKKEK